MRVRWLAAGTLGVLVLAFAVTFDYSILARSDLQARRWGLVFPAIGLLALTGVAPSFIVDVPLWGGAVELRQADAIPTGAAGFTAPFTRLEDGVRDYVAQLAAHA